jgi:hypothetical protein
MTSIIFAFIKHVLRIPLRLSEADLPEGDNVIHGEAPYAFELRPVDLEARIPTINVAPVDGSNSGGDTGTPDETAK